MHALSDRPAALYLDPKSDPPPSALSDGKCLYHYCSVTQVGRLVVGQNLILLIVPWIMHGLSDRPGAFDGDQGCKPDCSAQ